MESALALGEQEIHLWLADYHQAEAPALRARLSALLSDAEREQEKAFRSSGERLRHVVTRAMVRTVLSRYAPVAPAGWEFAFNAYGRPEIAASQDTHGLRFNVSHTRGLIALAVSRKRMLGVDIENIARRAPSPEIATRFFSPAEVAELEALPAPRRNSRFFEYWTFKESYIKARGMGLFLPLDQFSFHFPGEQEVGFDADARIDDDPQRWRFWQCRPGPDYLLALCAESHAGAAPTVTVRQLLPAGQEVLVETAWLKTSSRAAAA